MVFSILDRGVRREYGGAGREKPSWTLKLPGQFYLQVNWNRGRERRE